MLSRIEFIFSLHSLLGNQSSHINNPSNNLNVKLCVRSQVTRKSVLSQYQVGFKWRTTTRKLLNIFQILVRCFSFALLRSICILPAVLQYPTQLHLIIPPAKWMLNIILRTDYLYVSLGNIRLKKLYFSSEKCSLFSLQILLDFISLW